MKIRFDHLLLLLAAVLPVARLNAQSDNKPGFLDFKITPLREMYLKLDPSTNAVSRIETSTDLLQWTPLYSFPFNTKLQEYSDSASPYHPYRYYRSVQLQSTNKLGGDVVVTTEGEAVIQPINHATFVVSWNGKTLYFDPVGGASRFVGLPRPDFIFITHAHGDHFDAPTLNAISATNAAIFTPMVVYQSLSAALKAKTTVMTNGQIASVQGISIEAVPSYNTTPGRTGNHPKGVGNGYVVTLGGKRFYICGDTEDVPEMRALKNIDVAFICMNLPYTMDVNQAASAVREFRPAVVYPYHYQNTSSKDIDKFKQTVGTDLGIEVRLRKWY